MFAQLLKWSSVPVRPPVFGIGGGGLSSRQVERVNGQCLPGGGKYWEVKPFRVEWPQELRFLGVELGPGRPFRARGRIQP